MEQIRHLRLPRCLEHEPKMAMASVKPPSRFVRRRAETAQNSYADFASQRPLPTGPRCSWHPRPSGQAPIQRRPGDLRRRRPQPPELLSERTSITYSVFGRVSLHRVARWQGGYTWRDPDHRVERGERHLLRCERDRHPRHRLIVLLTLVDFPKGIVGRLAETNRMLISLASRRRIRNVAGRRYLPCQISQAPSAVLQASKLLSSD
jgi:hypothetical protein